MVNTPPQERPPAPTPQTTSAAPQGWYTGLPPTTSTYDVKGYVGEELNTLFDGDYSTGDPRLTEDVLRRPSLLPAATAAAALASLHNHRAEYDWDSDPVCACAVLLYNLR